MFSKFKKIFSLWICNYIGRLSSHFTISIFIIFFFRDIISFIGMFIGWFNDCLKSTCRLKYSIRYYFCFTLKLIKSFNSTRIYIKISYCCKTVFTKKWTKYFSLLWCFYCDIFRLCNRLSCISISGGYFMLTNWVISYCQRR